MLLTTARTRYLRKNWKVATIKEIRDRINSVNDTRKITNAMYLISSTKMRRARKEAEETKPYFDLLRKEIRRMFAIEGDITSRYYDSSVDEAVAGGRNGILIITGDKGLAGAYNPSSLGLLLSASSEATGRFRYARWRNTRSPSA